MAGGYQQVTIVGNLGRDPEMRYTPSGRAVTSFSVAVSTGSGEYEHTEWFNCVAWEKPGEIINQYCNKGSKIMVVGTLKTEEYEKDGEKKRITKLTVRDFTLLGSKRDADEEEAPTTPTSQRKAAMPAKNAPKPVDDDLPF